MNIVHVAAELAPVAKVGGLGDVLQGLSRALVNKEHKVTVLLPKYDSLALDWVDHLEILSTDNKVLFDGLWQTNTIWKGRVSNIDVLFIESHDPLRFFDRGTIYGCADDVARFSAFCLAAMNLIQKMACDVIHLHDWHTAILAPLIKKEYPKIKAKVIFTIHNLAYQGLSRGDELDRGQLRFPELKEGGVYNLMRGALIFADHITTVSPNYAKELLTTELGGNLQQLLQLHHKKFSGILNGIDYAFWNPASDPFLPYNYTAQNPRDKTKNKAELKKRFNLVNEEAPLVGAVTRLVPQKGPELIKASMLRTLELGGQFILLGSCLDERTHSHFYNLKRKLAPSPHIHLELSYNEELSHLLFAAADIFLIPSIFEPCGLTQQIAMRYGTVPVARETGGLIDTVFDEKNGFTFHQPTAEAIHGALDRAIETWHHKPRRFEELMTAGFNCDFSWNNPAEEYLKVYQSALLSCL